MNKIIGVNGIASHGEGNTDIALRHLATLGYKTHDLNQKVRHVWNVRWTKEKDAKAIIDIAEDGDAIWCHSYGAIKTAIAMRTITFSVIFFFRPAMNRGYKFYTHGKTSIYCIHSVGDLALWSGSLLRFDHPFGLAGVYGFKDPHVMNIKSYGRHNEDFEPTNIDKWVHFVDTALIEANFEKGINYE